MDRGSRKQERERWTDRQRDKEVLLVIVVVQPLSHVQLFVIMNCSTSGFPVFHYLLEFAQTEVH